MVRRVSTVVVNASRIYEDILNALLREETELARVEALVVTKYRKWWNGWMNKGLSDKEIVTQSTWYGVTRYQLEEDIDKLKALSMMCGDAIRDGTTLTLCRKDYELIYKE